jgi:exopolyphosphatase/guanosine-5'-triphosphate,3'-diphosphate pyrophosphatase
MRFFEGGRITRDGFRAAQVAAGAEFEEGLQSFAPKLWSKALGSSGTAGAVSQLLQASGVTDGRITPAGLRWCMARCLDAGHVDRIDLPGLKPERRAVLPGGLAILYTLSAHFDIRALWPAKGALRQGVIVDLHERLLALHQALPGDMRDTSVADLQRRFGVDTAQAGRVAAVALALFDSAVPDPDPEMRRELAWACALHEVGLMVSHHDHHRHSAYLLGHVDAPGFSQSQQRRIGDLVLGQRGGLRKMEPLLASETFAWQVLCLRLAVIKCHARGEADPSALRLAAMSVPRQPAEIASPVLAATKIDGVQVLQNDGKRVRVLFSPEAREAAAKVKVTPYVERVAASDNLRWTLGGGAAADDEPLGQAAEPAAASAPAVTGSGR